MVHVFPNPAKGNLNVSHDKAVRGASIKIMDLNGKLLRVYPVQAGATQTGLGITELVNGNYVVVFENNGAKSVTQFSKQ